VRISAHEERTEGDALLKLGAALPAGDAAQARALSAGADADDDSGVQEVLAGAASRPRLRRVIAA
jgi:hypothetical protein